MSTTDNTTSASDSPIERARAFASQHLDPLAPYFLSLTRAAAGFFLAAHGLSKIDNVERFASGLERKGFPAAPMFAYLAIFGELVCGTLLGLGAATRPAAVFCSITMFVAVLSSHLSDMANIGGKGGSSFEYPMLLALVCLSFVFVGGGPAGVDAIVTARTEDDATTPTPAPAK